MTVYTLIFLYIINNVSICVHDRVKEFMKLYFNFRWQMNKAFEYFAFYEPIMYIKVHSRFEFHVWHPIQRNMSAQWDQRLYQTNSQDIFDRMHMFAVQ